MQSKKAREAILMKTEKALLQEKSEGTSEIAFTNSQLDGASDTPSLSGSQRDLFAKMQRGASKRGKDMQVIFEENEEEDVTGQHAKGSSINKLKIEMMNKMKSMQVLGGPMDIQEDDESGLSDDSESSEKDEFAADLHLQKRQKQLKKFRKEMAENLKKEMQEIIEIEKHGLEELSSDLSSTERRKREAK